MQSVSESWKAAQLNTIVPMSYVEISYQAGNIEAQESASATVESGGETSYSDIDKVIDLVGTPECWAMLEHNSWILDGNNSIIPDSLENEPLGYVSSVLSNSNAVFETVPTIKLIFPELVTQGSEGVTIVWSSAYGELARSFRITTYNGSIQVDQITVINNSDISRTVDFPINNYDSITFEILEWSLPNRRCRIDEILLGVNKVFGKSSLMGYEHEIAADPLSAILPKNSIVFKISNVDGYWNPENPQGAAQYLAERQKIMVKYGYKIGDSIEWIKAGTFWLSEWYTPQNGITAQFTARDATEFMSGKYTGRTTGTLFEIASDAFMQADLPLNEEGNPRYEIDSSLSSISVSSVTELSDHTIAEVLQMCANAACCVLMQDRDGQYKITQLSYVLSDYVINRFNSWQEAEIELSKELKSVSVNNNLGTSQNSLTGEIQTVENPLIQNATVANNVASWVKDILKNRKTVTGEYRSDPRLDALDYISLSNKYTSNSTVLITSIKYTYNGAFRGRYEGRIIS